MACCSRYLSSSPAVLKQIAVHLTTPNMRHPCGYVPLRMLARILHQASSFAHTFPEVCPTKTPATRRSAVAAHLNCLRKNAVMKPLPPAFLNCSWMTRPCRRRHSPDVSSAVRQPTWQTLRNRPFSQARRMLPCQG